MHLAAREKLFDPKSEPRGRKKSKRREEVRGAEPDLPRKLPTDAVWQRANVARDEHFAERSTRNIVHGNKKSLVVAVRL